jgi:hypothetical protein
MKRQFDALIWIGNFFQDLNQVEEWRCVVNSDEASNGKIKSSCYRLWLHQLLATKVVGSGQGASSHPVCGNRSHHQSSIITEPFEFCVSRKKVWTNKVAHVPHAGRRARSRLHAERAKTTTFQVHHRTTVVL